MLVLAPAACIMSGIALSEAFSVFTRSIKLQLPKIAESAFFIVLLSFASSCTILVEFDMLCGIVLTLPVTI